MAKIGSLDFRTQRGQPDTSMPMTGMPMMGVAQFEAMLAANRAFLQVAEEINKSWVDAMQDAATSGSDLATRLCRCGNPLEAAELCNRWLGERAEKLVSQGQQASEMCLKLYRSAVQSAEAVASTIEPGQDSADAPRSAQAA
jgi:hypothetical protein